MKERGTLVLKENSWHCRLYRFWQGYERKNRKSVPGKASSYKENLCHYWRVVMFWAPLRAFLYAHPKNATWLRPWTVVGATAAVSGLTASFILWPGTTLKSILIFLGSIVGATLVMGGLFYIENHPEPFQRFFGKLGDGIWKVIGPVCRLIGRAAEWFLFHDYYLKTIYPWSVAILLAWLITLALWPTIVLTVTVCVFAVAGLVTGSVFLGFHIHEALDEQPKKEKKVKVDHGPGMFKVTGRYLVARKHGICPFIEIEQ